MVQKNDGANKVLENKTLLTILLFFNELVLRGQEVLFVKLWKEKLLNH